MEGRIEVGMGRWMREGGCKGEWKGRIEGEIEGEFMEWRMDEEIKGKK